MIATYSNGVGRLPIAPDDLPIVFRGEGRHAKSPHSDSKFIAMFNPVDDANGC
jgi:hypothetical protein